MSDLWATPKDLFKKLDEEFYFDLDVCAISTNAKCRDYFTPEMNGLEQEWYGVCWMNPPYGREIGLWMRKAFEHTGVVVALVPTRSNAPWWHDYVMKANEIRFVKHKVSFEGDKDGVPFWGVAIVVFRPGKIDDPPRVSTYIQPKHEKKEKRKK